VAHGDATGIVSSHARSGFRAQPRRASVSPDYGSPVFAQLRDASADAWQGHVTHEFVRQLGDGSLHRGAFVHYLRQDYVFLFHFSRAWALAVVKSESRKEMELAAGTVHALVNEEMQLHVKTCAAEGISAEALFATEEAPENLAYTRFVMDTGLSGDLLDLLVALVPCVIGYGEIGRHLAGTAKVDQAHPYRNWIDTYSGDEYQATCRQVGALLERCAAARIGPALVSSPRWPRLVQRFRAACLLEQNFWSMGLRGGY